ncbi:alpha/beta hydrolase [Ottowia sp. GY511]|uniref:Alpha/beta hydrolase n=1 Tax=Ottowia flava TaxID=2675430 RepID=A0ABW4KYQ8_9BURK|nr:alpha/beta hydrolase [Ottowia sp. GY511]TXK27002.1 alpha/beta hydrolase [Ottowia sp. GY511]
MSSDVTPTLPGSALDDTLALHDWPLSIGWPIRGQVLMLHGLGEHIGHYTDLADSLNQWGFAVRGYDHYGHGESSGQRGELPQDDRLIQDLAAVIDDTRARMDDRLPLILFGHCLGGLVAARLVSQKLRRIDGLVLSSPPLRAGLGFAQRALVRSLNAIVPQWPLGIGVPPEMLTHDVTMAQAFRLDALQHDRMSARLAHFLVSAGPAVLARAPRWKVPTLLLYAGQDKLVDPAGSRQFAQTAPPEVVTSHGFPMHFHALFHELQRQPVYDMLQQWLWSRYPAMALEWSGAPA